MAANPSAREFLLAEYSSRKEHFFRHVGQVVDDQRFAFVATGAFWAWILTHPLLYGMSFLVWLPSLLALFFMTKWLVFRRSIRGMVRYMQDVEGAFDLPEELGWVRNYWRYSRDLLGPFATTFWVLLLILNVLAAALVLSLSVLVPGK